MKETSRVKWHTSMLTALVCLPIAYFIGSIMFGFGAVDVPDCVTTSGLVRALTLLWSIYAVLAAIAVLMVLALTKGGVRAALGGATLPAVSYITYFGLTARWC